MKRMNYKILNKHNELASKRFPPSALAKISLQSPKETFGAFGYN